MGTLRKVKHHSWLLNSMCKLLRAKAAARVCRSSCAVQAAAHTDMHSTLATGDSYKVKQIKVNIVAMDFVASLSLLTRGIQGGIATFARVTMAVMVGYPPKVIHKYWVHPFQLLEYQWSEGK